jgi:putative tryptophan/tyrosine transport system substrate-binding protein
MKIITRWPVLKGLKWQASLVTDRLCVIYRALGITCTLLVTLSAGVEAQQAQNIPRLGYLTAGSSEADEPRLAIFREALRDLGYSEKKNIFVEYRFADGKLERLPELAAELARREVNIIIAAGNEAVQAAKDATQSIPIVMAFSGDPLEAGFVASLARPGGNITGLSRLNIDLSAKRLELLKDAAPSLTRVAVLFHPEGRFPVLALKEARAAAERLALQLLPVEVRAPEDIEPGFRVAVKERAGAVMTLPGGFIGFHRKRFVELATRNRLPAIYPNSRFVAEGGLMSYGSDAREEFRRAAFYVDRILKGAKPADLPIEQPTKFEFAINLKTAKQIGLTIPPNVLARADRVIR